MNKTVVFIILDAFRWDYLDPEDTPLLTKMVAEGIHVKRLVTSTGFTQRSAIFCGAPPDVTGNFTMYTFDPQNSPYRFLKESPEWISRRRALGRTGWWEALPNMKGCRRVRRVCRERHDREVARFRSRLSKESKNYATYAPVGHVPLGVLPFIGVSEDNRPIYEGGAFSVESIFDIVLEQGVSYQYLLFPIALGDDDAVQRTALERISEKAQLYLLQFSASDSLMHHHGTSGEMRHKVAGELDRKLRVLRRAFEKVFDTMDWVIIGDHGMTDVTKEVNAQDLVHSLAQRRGLKHGQDYVLFLDSTMARLWHLTDQAKSFVESVFHEERAFSDNGAVITEATAKRYRIPYQDRRYGDAIWWANPGVLVFPDYFHNLNTHNKGMHGYDSYHEDMKGFAVVSGDDVPAKQIEEGHLVDICPTLCDLLEMRYPVANEGRSVLQ